MLPVNNEYKSLEDIELALYNNNNVIRCIVSGVGDYLDTCNFYAKLHNTCVDNSDWLFIDNGFPKPTYEQSSRLPRFANDKHDFIVFTLTKFLEIDNNEYKEELTEAIKQEFNKTEYTSLTASIFYNKVANVVCIFNNIYKQGKPSCVYYYGKANSRDLIVLRILNNISHISLVIACSDKSNTPLIKDMQTLELRDSLDVFPVPLVDKRDGSATLAAQVERTVNATLFSGDTLGMYKPGQFKNCQAIPFNLTYDELKLWWNKDTYLRPGFKAQGNTAIIPSIFKVIKGWTGDANSYLKEVQQYCCGKTIICVNRAELSDISYIHHSTDTYGTSFSEQKSFIQSNGKLDKERIKNGKNYAYKMLSHDKQEIILDKIEELLNSNKINTSHINSQDYIDNVLNIGLHLPAETVRLIQWFEFYTYSPNVVYILHDETQLTLKDMIYMVLLQSLGLDILLFVPTCYQSIEDLCGPEFVYTTNIIGEANYSINSDTVARLRVTNNIEISETDTTQKKGFFSKLFH